MGDGRAMNYEPYAINFKKLFMQLFIKVRISA